MIGKFKLEKSTVSAWSTLVLVPRGECAQSTTPMKSVKATALDCALVTVPLSCRARQPT